MRSVHHNHQNGNRNMKSTKSNKQCIFYWVLLFGFAWIILRYAETSHAGSIPLFLKVDGYSLNIKKSPRLLEAGSEVGSVYKFDNIKIIFPTTDGKKITERVYLFYQEKSVTEPCIYDWLFIGTIDEEQWLKTKKDTGYVIIHVTSDDYSKPKALFEADIKCNTLLGDANLAPSISKTIFLIGKAIPPKPPFIAKPKCRFIQEDDKEILQVTLPNQKSIRFFPVQPGAFYFGASATEIEEGFKRIQRLPDYEGPQTKQEISKRYWVSEFELTVGEFFSYLNNNQGFQNSLQTININEWQKYWKGFYQKVSSSTTKEKDFQYPIIKVLKSDVERLIAWLNHADWEGNTPSGYKFDLPTEIEWEYAAKGPNDRGKWYFPWGNTEKDAENNAVFSVAEKAIVGSKKGGKSWCNAQDMAGNVHEIVRNSYFKYQDLKAMKESGWTTIHAEEQIVARGGAYNTSLWECRASSRYQIYPDVRLPNMGARIFFVERNDDGHKSRGGSSAK
jgi:formylglycine-generating enzyme required for sulfatase activity